MPAIRRFADFYEGALPFQMDRIPEGGMCLSAFLILWKGDKQSILLGKIDPEYDWVKTGALSMRAAERVGQRWMLPSSHLLLYESAHEAAKRILDEQLRLSWRDTGSAELLVFSEAYGKPKHWDTEFVFKAEMSGQSPSANPAWVELKFIDVTTLADSDFARNHHDILSEAGLR